MLLQRKQAKSEGDSSLEILKEQALVSIGQKGPDWESPAGFNVADWSIVA